MVKYAKFISEDCAAGAPTMKGGKPYTEEMAIADGFLPLEVLPADEGLKNPVAKYKVNNGKIVEYYVEGPVIEEVEEPQMVHMIDDPNAKLQ